jgi:hypothetical protein
MYDTFAFITSTYTTYVIFGVFPSSLAFKYGKRKIVVVRREAARREGMFVSGGTAAHILNIGI